jgi:hypothetical protein
MKQPEPKGLHGAENDGEPVKGGVTQTQGRHMVYGPAYEVVLFAQCVFARTRDAAEREPGRSSSMCVQGEPKLVSVDDRNGIELLILRVMTPSKLLPSFPPAPHL